MKNRNQKKQTYLKASKNEENKIKNNLKSISKFQNPNSKLHSGITLIALVVTVVVLLILAGVTITLMFGENNIFDLAKDAADKTNKAIEDEQKQIDDLNKWLTENGWSSENGGNGGSGENPENPEDPDVPPTSNLPDGWNGDKVSIVPGTESNPVPLPNGFVKSEINGEQNVNTGLVIYQIPEADRTDDIWTKNETGDAEILDVQEKYNQFVWVPVDDPSEMFGTDSSGNSLGKLYDFGTSSSPKNPPTALNWTETTGENPVMSWTASSGSGSYREPDVVTNASGTTGTSCDGASSNYTNANIKYKDTNTIITTATQFKEQLQEEFEAMRDSVETYGGFYIGRYETGNWHESTNAYGNTNAVVVRGCDDILATSTSDSKATWYAYYQKSKEVTNDANIKSSMLWGCQWDATLKWFISSENKTIGQITSSGDWGNYSSSGIKATGSSDTYQANQIYDMAGNVDDWTIEASYTALRSLRGGSCGLSGSIHPASSRDRSSPTDSLTSVGSRLALYM